MTSKVYCTLLCAFTLLAPINCGTLKLTRSRLSKSENVNGGHHGVVNMNQDAFGTSPPGSPVCDKTADEARFDCAPGQMVNQQLCEAKGCCWKAAVRKDPNHYYAPSLKRPINVPYCYFPQNYDGYKLVSIEDTTFGQSGTLTRTTKSGWPKDVMQLKIDIYFDTQTRLRFKIYDPNNKRYEVPIPTPKPGPKAQSTDYDVKLTKAPFGITVTRKSTGAVLFDSAIAGAPFVFADQFIQISTHTGTGLVYGLGEHKAPFLKKPTWDQYTFWARDHGPAFETNLYGDHPFYVNLEKDGQSHGVFLLNSNAMDVDIQPLPALTYRTIGGVLDFFVFTGPSPDSVVEQYTDVILKPFMPPYWALGFHLCRYEYPDSTVMKKVIERNRAIGIPYDVQWNDIDYMDKYLDWTYDKKAYGDLPEIVKDLHVHNQKYVIIVDPGISNTQPVGTYPPYDEGIRDGVFMLNASGQVLIGSVWPGATAYPDFTHPNTTEWWYRQANRYHNQVPFDGLWVDMNEPSNFVYGSTVGCPQTELDNPPYVPGVSDGKLPALTVCPSAKQFIGRHYDLHSLYGLTEVVSTNIALKKVRPGKRPFVITRSSYPSEGHYGGHWSGDIHSTWEDLHYSIPSILNFQLFGVPFVGADICGFTGDTTEELCTRWMQLGAFYPFMRNHNDRGYKEQDPAAFSSTAQQSMKKALEMRYTMLPYMYSRLHLSHVKGTPVVRPLAFQYPQDATTADIDTQFLWGSEILVTPVLQQGATSVKGYLPKDRWYGGDDNTPVDSSGQWTTLEAPLDTINYHIRGGSILPLQSPGVTTVTARTTPFNLTVALDKSGSAAGFLYWDDGDTLEAYENGSYTAVHFKAEKKTITSSVEKSGYRPASGMVLFAVNVLGISEAPKDLTVNGNPAKFSYNAKSQYLQIPTSNITLLKNFTIQWK